jgi:hypothetical protein
MHHLYLSPTALRPIWSNESVEKLVAYANHGFDSYAWVIRDDASHKVRANEPVLPLFARMRGD